MKRAVPILMDVICVVIFASRGRAAHGLDPLGLLSTAWPFLIACLAAWVGLALLKLPGPGWREGLIIWSVTVVGGMGLRLVSGRSVGWAFVGVTALLLGAMFLGWRVIATLFAKRRARTA